jgi:hypothetical protein
MKVKITDEQVPEVTVAPGSKITFENDAAEPLLLVFDEQQYNTFFKDGSYVMLVWTGKDKAVRLHSTPEGTITYGVYAVTFVGGPKSLPGKGKGLGEAPPPTIIVKRGDDFAPGTGG